MSISYAETVPLTCPRCGTPFSAESYIIVDGVERPDLVARILNDTLHDARCPNCGQVGRVPAPLLYHDGPHTRVLLGVPPDMSEAEWREIGQTLLWTLIGQLPAEARLPYLGDVQAEAGLAGVAQVIRNERLAGSGGEDEGDVPPIVIAIQALLTAQNSDELLRALDDHAILQQPQATTIMRELAFEARKGGEIEAANGFNRAAELLEQVKQLRAQMPEQPADRLTPDQVENLAFALLRSATGQQLADAVDQHPELLDEATEQALIAYAATARGQNKLRVADGVTERLEAIRDMRSQYRANQPVLDAVQAYLQADTPDAIEAIILERDELTTDAADRALERLAAGARAEGDADFARFVDERRAFLRQVRSALEGD